MSKPNAVASSCGPADSVLKIITETPSDGTLFTNDWDAEPLFPLPETDAMSKKTVTGRTNVKFVPSPQQAPGKNNKRSTRLGGDCFNAAQNNDAIRSKV
ncbi:hypothetical protein MKW92_050778 [Papaver armeniacum]|nr:hypothetical protein MKW92_050778 [Papaver armeniacum]